MYTQQLSDQGKVANQMCPHDEQADACSHMHCDHMCIAVT